jgi:hypothetical protein
MPDCGVLRLDRVSSAALCPSQQYDAIRSSGSYKNLIDASSFIARKVGKPTPEQPFRSF